MQKNPSNSNKERDKKYFSHTGYPGGGKETSLADIRRSKPEKLVHNAVKGMCYPIIV